MITLDDLELKTQNSKLKTFFTELLEIYSPSFAEREVAEYLVAKMSEWGLRDAHVDGAGNAVAELGATAETATKTIVALGHIDTVPGFIPVQVMDDGDTIYGRGSVDAKGPFASFVLGAAALVEKQDELAAAGKRIVLVGAVEEEAASSKGARFVADLYRPDFCIIGEPSSWSRVTLGYKGRLLLDYKLARDTRHTAADGPSACEEAVDYWNAVKAYANSFNEGKSIFETLQPSLRSMQSQANGFQEIAFLKLGFRLPVGFPIDEFKQLLTQEWPNGAEIELSGEELPIKTDKNNKLVRAFLSAIRAEGGQPAFRYKTGTSDMNVLAPVWQCPFLAYGPGDSSLDHTPNEHTTFSELARSVRIMSNVFDQL